MGLRESVSREDWLVIVNPYVQLSQSFSARIPFDSTTTVKQLYEAAEKEFDVPGLHYIIIPTNIT
jgi:hypothetical protein